MLAEVDKARGCLGLTGQGRYDNLSIMHNSVLKGDAWV